MSTRRTATPTRAHARPRPAKEREGAVMIVVMLVLLSVTALAMFAVHATTFELRAAGNAREGMQSQLVAESGLVAAMALVDRTGPQAILHAMEQTRNDPMLGVPELMPFEPSLAAGKDGYRIFLDDLAVYGDTVAMDGESLYGLNGDDATKQAYQPTFIVDVNDHYTYTAPVAGQRSDGFGRLQYLHATYTARGRMRLAAGDVTDGSGRTVHELASDARARAVTGPFGR